MISITKATAADAELVAAIATQSFTESHGHSAAPEDIQHYVTEKYNRYTLETELKDTKNKYRIICVDGKAAGYSKILLDTPYENSPIARMAKLERIYLLKEYYGMQAGSALFDHTIGFAKAAQQEAVWLFVWEENDRAIRFYKKKGFVIIGSYDFPISATHSNPNHQMLLGF
jgi:diamine N-acetyltransferase